MLSKKMEAALNDQIKWELWSAYLYLSMAAYFAEQGLAGFANWMRVQEQEERFHGMLFFDYALERGGSVKLQSFEAPPNTWKSPLAAFEEVLKHEQGVTARINALMDLAIKEKDHAMATRLTWFVNEQVEEEASALDVIQKLKLVSGNPSALFLLDKDMAARVFTAPTNV